MFSSNFLRCYDKITIELFIICYTKTVSVGSYPYTDLVRKKIAYFFPYLLSYFSVSLFS